MLPFTTITGSEAVINGLQQQDQRHLQPPPVDGNPLMQPNIERSVAPTTAATDSVIIPNQYIVVLKPTMDTKREAVATEVKSHGSHLFHNFGNIIKGLTNEIRSKLIRKIEGIVYDLKQKLSLHIEHGQAIKWLEILCNCLFEFTQSSTYNLKFKADFDFIEVQLL